MMTMMMMTHISYRHRCKKKRSNNNRKTFKTIKHDNFFKKTVKTLKIVTRANN